MGKAFDEHDSGSRYEPTCADWRALRVPQELNSLHQDLCFLEGRFTSQLLGAQPPWSAGFPPQGRLPLIPGWLILQVQVLLKPSSLGDINEA